MTHAEAAKEVRSILGEIGGVRADKPQTLDEALAQLRRRREALQVAARTLELVAAKDLAA